MLSKPSNRLFLSLSDFKIGIAESKKKIVLAGIITGLLLASYQAIRLPTYTAKSIFKSVQPPQSSFSQTFENLALIKGDTYIPKEDPYSLLCSSPVLQKVIQHCHLQGEIFERKRISLLKRVVGNLKVERAYFLFKIKKRPPSTLLTKQEIVPDTLFETPGQGIFCEDVIYKKLYATSFGIRFIEGDIYTVSCKGKLLGKGYLGSPFKMDDLTFTLKGNRKKSTEFTLSLIPESFLVNALTKRIQLKKDKNNRNLIHISFTHTHPHVAKKLTNALMEEYRSFLKEEGKDKITAQLSYLQERQNSLVEALEMSFYDYEEFLKNHLLQGGFLLFKNELHYFSGLQAKHYTTLNHLEKELGAYLQLVYPENTPSLNEFTTYKKELNEHQELSLDPAKELLAQYQKKYDSLQLQEDQIHSYLQEIAKPGLAIEIFTNLSHDQAFSPLLQKAHQLRLNLVDKKNWSLLEQERQKEELEILKAFLEENFLALKESYRLQKESLKLKIFDLQKNILNLLYEEFDQTKKALNALNETLLHYPKKWITEEKLELDTAIHKKIISSLYEVIEAKNIAYNTSFIDSYPLLKADIPSLPNSPQLTLLWMIGTCFGSLLMLGCVLVKEAYEGPKASFSNVRFLTPRVIDKNKDFLPSILFWVREKPMLPHVVLCASKEFFSLPSALFAFLEGPILIIRVEENTPYLLEKKEEYDDLVAPLKELCKNSFKQLIHPYKHVFIYVECSIESFTYKMLQKMTHTFFYKITDEKLNAIDSDPETIFITEERTTKKEFISTKKALNSQKHLHLKQIVPLIESLKKNLKIFH